MKPAANRYELLRQAFSEVPLTVGPHQLRPLSGGSFELLGTVGNALVVSSGSASFALQDLLTAVHEYVWIHAAPIDAVAAIQSRESLPRDEIRRYAFDIPMGEALAFTTTFAAAAARMAAAMAEAEEEEGDSSPGKRASSPIGSPPSSSPAELPEIPSGSATSSGSPPSIAPSNISTPPTSSTEPPAAGSTPSMMLPQDPPKTPSGDSKLCESNTVPV